MIVELKEVTFFMKKMLKHNRAGEALDVISLKAFEPDYDICVVCAVQEYLKRTKKLRSPDPIKSKDHQFILSHTSPYKPVSRDTISKYTLGVLDLAGINIAKYGKRKYAAHSTRGASTSKAKSLGVPINTIMAKAAWRNASSFANFYDRPIESDPDRFGQVIQAEAHERRLQKKRANKDK